LTILPPAGLSGFITIQSLYPRAGSVCNSQDTVAQTLPANNLTAWPENKILNPQQLGAVFIGYGLQAY